MTFQVYRSITFSICKQAFAVSAGRSGLSARFPRALIWVIIPDPRSTAFAVESKSPEKYVISQNTPRVPELRFWFSGKKVKRNKGRSSSIPPSEKVMNT